MHDPKPLTKSDFMLFLDCPLHLWAAAHDQLAPVPPSRLQKRLAEQGRQIEALADTIVAAFAGSRKVERQPDFVDGDFSARPDFMLVDPATGAVDLVEVKSSSSVKKEHELDLAFQALVAKATLDLRNVYLVHVNREYVRRGEIDPSELLVIEDLTKKIDGRLEEVRAGRAAALAAARQPSPEGIVGCTKPATCLAPDLCHPDLPENPIYELSRIGKKALELKAMGITAIEDIPEDFPLSPAQRAQAELVRSGEPEIDHEAIDSFLGNAVYPLYFLDYETVNPALPPFNGYRPYDLAVFQFSLDILPAPGEDPVHHECLSIEDRDPAPVLAARLESLIGPVGSIVVWNQSFEKRCNSILARQVPDKGDFLEGLNGRLFDLMEVFRKGHYRHHGFRGSASLKNVLPILIPELTYEGLVVQDGEAAMQVWWELVAESPDPERREMLEEALRVYCALDTEAMVKIWELLSR
jgi:hypothetical protein